MELEYKLATDKDDINIRRLWEKIFIEDSKSYLDFYFKYVRPTNKVIAVYDGELLCAMLHLNPYYVKFTSSEEAVKIYYIVAVATLAEYRRQGIMKKMLKLAENIAKEDQVNTLILLPADERYYTPFGYEFASEQFNTTLISSVYGLSGTLDVSTIRRIAEDSLDEEGFKAAFKQETSYQLSKYSAVHTSELARRIFHELEADGGKAIVVDGHLILYYLGETLEVRKIYWNKESRCSSLKKIKDVLLYLSDGKSLILHETNVNALGRIFEYNRSNQYDRRPYMMIKHIGENIDKGLDIEKNIGFDEIV
ncbi:GNAT family N-acetyltransferase [Dethiosulfatibacter aminovorans]|nr:GNAT family N-acetyltransferase [Dethiosulfatibacter aminovorans]